MGAKRADISSSSSPSYKSLANESTSSVDRRGQDDEPGPSSARPTDQEPAPTTTQRQRQRQRNGTAHLRPQTINLPFIPLPISVDAIAGFTAGTVATLVVHPLDLLKIRLQLDQSPGVRWGRSLRILRDIALKERPRGQVSLPSPSPSPASPVPHRRFSPRDVASSVRALYRGLGPNLVGNSASWGMYFFFYQEFKSGLSRRNGRNDSHDDASGSSSSTGEPLSNREPTSPPHRQPNHLSPSEYFAASSSAGVLTVLLTNPIWVLKTRMLSSGVDSPGAYPSIRSGFKSILKNEGVKGLYHGLGPSLLGVSHGAAQFAVYEVLKDWRLADRQKRMANKKNGDGSFDDEAGPVSALSTLDVLLCSIVSKATAAALTYPYQVVRARLQAYVSPGTSATTTTTTTTVPSRSISSVTADIWRREGVVGFYKGLGSNIVRVLPATCVTFVVYERVKAVLSE